MTPQIDKNIPVILPRHDPNASLSHAGDFNLVAMIEDYGPQKIKRLMNERIDLSKRLLEIELEMNQLEGLLEVIKTKSHYP